MYSTKPLLLCLVCVERYMAVVRPHDYLRYKEGCYRGSSMAVIWCIYILTAVCDVFSSVTTLVWVLFVCVFIVNTWLSMATLKALKKPPPGDRVMAEMDKKGEHKGKTSKSRGKGGTDSKKRRAFITIAIIQAVLTLNYLPSVMCVPLKLVVSPRVFSCQYMPLVVAASTSCGYLEPLLHLHRLVK
ncbi:hypothetical protein JOB18_032365 [Solea senegalensis]|uniref:G-protein coupled receptors family 1 profile domain-containing protein n=1 Tax=Solea senegalensis TaxID=28829 RepID=A0AAV6QVS5_SOLSE|nr:hypothetical protein JOB18_032365 [Solea senegalensis]